MIKNLISVIENVFLGNGVKVILATHSPTTIALCPEDSIFVINKEGMNRIEKKTRKEALEILTEGYATLDEGIKLFDQISQQKISIITEGKNTLYLQKALEIYNHTDIEIIMGVESKSGETQLRTLYDFFSKVPHKNSVIFVWDCDSYSKYGHLQSLNQTFPFIFDKNDENTLASKGMENLFPEVCLDRFVRTITIDDSLTTNTKREFNMNRKRELEEHILSRNNTDDFNNFKPLIDLIEKIKKQS